MKVTLQQLANWITSESGLEVKIQGNSSTVISRISTLKNASKGDITFLANKKYRSHLDQCKATAVILNTEDADGWPNEALLMDNPYVGFALVAQKLDTTPQQKVDIAPSATISSSAQLGMNISIGANAVIEDNVIVEDGVQIGAGSFIGQGTIIRAGSRIWPNVTLYHAVEIGQGVEVHSNSVIGADGFGYAPLKKDGEQHWIKIPQLGRVIVGNNTQVGSCTTIDRGAIDDTVIGKNVIIDNQIQIGHNVEIGDGTAIAAGAMIAGSTKIGKNVTIGGGSGITGHIQIVDGAFITAMTFVINDITEPGAYSSGMPATTNKEWRKNAARYRKLTDLFDRVKKLEKSIK